VRNLNAAPDDNRRLGRIVATVLVGLLVFCFATESEWWPFSGFSLFSQVRGPEQTSWNLYVVDSQGAREAVALDSLPESHWGSHHVLPTLPDASGEEQRAAARAWVQAAGYDLDEVEQVQVVRTVSLVPTDLDASAREVSQTVTLTIDFP